MFIDKIYDQYKTVTRLIKQKTHAIYIKNTSSNNYLMNFLLKNISHNKTILTYHSYS